MTRSFRWAVLVAAVSSFAPFHAADLALAADAVASSQWTQWRGPNRENHSPDTGLMKSWEESKPKLLATIEGIGSGYASVSVVDGKIYTTGDLSDGQYVFAIDEKTGKILWKQVVTNGKPKHSYDGSRCTPTVDGTRLYVVASEGSISCLNAANGKVLWHKNFAKEWKGKMMSGWGFSESPLVDGDLVLCTPGGKDAMIVALNKMTGALVWKSQETPEDSKGKSGAGYSSIVISNAAGVKQYVQLTGKGVIGVRASDGKLLWSYTDVANGTANIPTPIVTGDFVFASSGYGTGAALLKLAKDGAGVKAEEVYFLDAKTLQNHHGGMILLGDYIYCGHGHNNGFPICVELKSGKVIWGGSTRGVGSGSAAVTYADGNIIFRHQSGEVSLVEASTKGYVLKGSFKPEYVKSPSWAHPVVLGGKLYLREQDKLMIYSLKN